jgi:hypothetical protein
MILGMPSWVRPQQRYDHRRRDLVYRTGDVTLATDLGVPRSTARGWLGGPATVIVSCDVAARTDTELRQEVLVLRRRVQKLAALLRLVLAVHRASGFTLSRERLRAGRAKRQILGAIDQARAFRCGRSCGSFGCRRVGSMRGSGKTRVPSTTSRPVRVRRRTD